MALRSEWHRERKIVILAYKYLKTQQQFEVFNSGVCYQIRKANKLKVLELAEVATEYIS